MTKMTIRICLIIIITILIMSVVGVAGDNKTEKTKVVVISRNIGIDQNREVILASIATNKIGHLIYLEEYYSRNDSDPDKINLDNKIIYYNDTMTNNTLTLKIKRPLDKNGDQYKYVKAVAYIDNKRELNSWFKYGNKNDKNEKKKSPGFEIVILIVSILSVIYIKKLKKPTRGLRRGRNNIR